MKAAKALHKNFLWTSAAALLLSTQACGPMAAPSFVATQNQGLQSSELAAASQRAEENLIPAARSLCGFIATTTPQVIDQSREQTREAGTENQRTPHTLALKLAQAESCPRTQQIVLTVDGAEKKQPRSRVWSILEKLGSNFQRPEFGDFNRTIDLSSRSITFVNLGFLADSNASTNDDLRLFFRNALDPHPSNTSRIQICGYGKCLKDNRCGNIGDNRGMPIGAHSENDLFFSCYFTPGRPQSSL